MGRFHPSLTQLSWASLLVLLALLAAMYAVLLRGTQESLSHASTLLLELDRTSRMVESEVTRFLDEPRRVLHDLQERFDPDTLEQFLRESLTAHRGFAEVTFTFEEPALQLSAFTNRQGEVVFRTQEGLKVREHSGGQTRTFTTTEDPRKHPTYTTIAARRNRRRDISTDLHYSQLDKHLPEAQRRVVVTVQRTIHDPDGDLLGVLRVGRVTGQLDELARLAPASGAHVFLCDSRGRLVTRLAAGDRVKLFPDDSLRVVSEVAPPEVLAALEKAHRLEDRPFWFGEVPGHLVSLQALPGTQGWLVAVVVPKSHFLAPLQEVQHRLLLMAVALILLIGGLVVVVFRTIHRDLEGVAREAQRVRDFDFEAREPAGFVQEARQVSLSLESAKSTLRAMVKYVPLELVKQLFEQRLKPVLGGEVREVTLMFTDIRGFTSLAEKMTIQELADLLGDYLERMTSSVHEWEGTLLERVGDALLVVWNAPSEVEDHPSKACAAALRALASTDVETGFGIHTASVMVGHFGSRERMNYGVLGDDVNLASRLEGLTKHYGVSIIVSRPAREAAVGFEFRHLDRVAVKGRTGGIDIYELLGRQGEVPPEVLSRARAYEQAFDHYLARRFDQALALLDPAEPLAERCRHYLTDPPPPDWDGIFVAQFK